MAFMGDNGEIISYADLNTIATELDQHAATVKKDLDDVSTLVGDLKSAWRSEDATEFENQFNSFSVVFKNFHGVISEHAQILRTIVAEHEKRQSAIKSALRSGTQGGGVAPRPGTVTESEQ